MTHAKTNMMGTVDISAEVTGQFQLSLFTFMQLIIIQII